MRELLAWTVLIVIVAMWLLVPWKRETVLRLFNAESDEELMRRFAATPRFAAGVGLVLLLDAAAAALALLVLI